MIWAMALLALLRLSLTSCLECISFLFKGVTCGRMASRPSVPRVPRSAKLATFKPLYAPRIYGIPSKRHSKSVQNPPFSSQAATGRIRALTHPLSTRPAKPRTAWLGRGGLWTDSFIRAGSGTDLLALEETSQ